LSIILWIQVIYATRTSNDESLDFSESHSDASLPLFLARMASLHTYKEYFTSSGA